MKSVILFILLCTQIISANELAKAPPNITFNGGTASAIDIAAIRMNLLIDANQKKAAGRSQVTFTSAGGFPMFLMKPKIFRASIDGKEIPLNSFADVTVVDKGVVRVLKLPLAAGTHLLDIEYDSLSYVTFSNGGARFAFWMDDSLDDGAFLNAYGPSNFEFDHFALRVEVNLVGQRTNQNLFSNGTVSRGRQSQWIVDFPAYFATSSFFLHFTDHNFVVDKFNYPGMQRSIPVTVYSESVSSNAKAKEQVIKSMTELEKSFGPYAHNSMTIYLAPPTNPMFAGMEHVGGAVTNLEALNHEIGHSWFARGVMPALGRDGWIDESIMVWRDRNYPMREFKSSDPGSGVGLVSPYLLGTNQTAYTLPFMSGLTSIAGSAEAMKAIMKKMYSQFVYKSITSVEFQNFMQQELKTDLTPQFKKYIYNNSALRDPYGPNRFHRRFTKEELKRLL